MASNTSTDITIIGASYAGLSCARTAAAHGLDVTILEAKPEVGFKPHTTGILVEEAYEHLPEIPQHLVRLIKGIRLYSPKLRHFDLFKGDYAFLAADTPGLLKWMADDVCQNERITLRTRAKFDGATQEQDRFAINNHDLDTRFIVGADGARSSVAKHFNLGVPNAMTETIFGSAMFRKFAQLIFFHHRGLLSKDAWKDIA